MPADERVATEGHAFTGWLRELPRGRWTAAVTADSYDACWYRLLAVRPAASCEKVVRRTAEGRP